MVSLIAAPSIHFMVSRHLISYLSSPSCFPIVFVVSPLKREHPLRSTRKLLEQKKQNQFLFEFSGFCGVVRKCKNWEGEDDPALELQVLEFMKNSKNPNMFPSRKDLIDAGRVDLLEAITKRGGWMTMGWEDEVSEDGFASSWEFSLEKYGQNGSESVERSGSVPSEERNCEGISFLGNSSPAASSSGRSLKLAAESDSGIEGMLNRLERQRNLSFGLKLGKNVNGDFGGRNQSEEIRKDVDSCHLQRSEPASNNPTSGVNGLSRSYSNGLSSSLNTSTWRTWSIQRLGFPDTDFEAGEIDFGENTNRGIVDKSIDDVLAVGTDIRRAWDETIEIDSYNREIGDLKTRLQHLEVELSFALRSLRSNTSDLSGKAKEVLFEDLRQLSDVSEFQENEIMYAQDKLRSLRAKLAVLEGKMALAIIDVQKILDKKQKRIDDARIALQLLRTTCIVWPNSGSEVLLAGSFDGWATQRKMTKSSTGIFSLCLKLYPGKYEIKFIVDGVWKVDPLRPIVNNNGFENNLLTIT